MDFQDDFSKFPTSTRTRKKISIKDRNFIISDVQGKVINSYKLNFTTYANVQMHRKNRIPFCLIKSNNTLALFTIPTSFSLSNTSINHLCRTCCRCQALPENEGGCPKVVDRCLTYNVEYSQDLTLETSKRLEKYPFITFGIETFGCSTEQLIVYRCEKYIPHSSEKIMKHDVKSLYELYLYLHPNASAQDFEKACRKMNGSV